MGLMGRIPGSVWCFTVLLLALPDVARGQAAIDDARAAIGKLHSYLGTTKKEEPKWRQYLMSDELQKQLAKGSQADRETVQNILSRYRGRRPGLERREFVAVRRSLEAWVQELPSLPIEKLAQAARDARATFVPLTPVDVQRAKQEFNQALGELERFLTREEEEGVEDWKEYLSWSELRKQLDAANGPDWNVLQGLAPRLYANESGLERPPFLKTRQALVHYVNTAWFASTPNAREQFQQQLDELAKHLDAFTKKPGTDEAVSIGRTLGWLEQFGQSAELVSAVRGHYFRPNLLAQLSTELIASGIASDVEEDAPVREVILGTRMYGTAHMAGHVSVKPVPNDRQAAIDLVLRGTTHSRNVGYNGPVKIYSRGVTSVDARKTLLIDAAGVTARRARAACRTRSTIQSIQARSALIEKIAWRKARQSKAEVEQIASRRAAGRIATRVDQQSAELLQKVNEAFQEYFRGPLLRRDAFPRTLAFRTTDQGLYVTALEAGPGDLAAPTEPPPLAADLHAAVRVHESLVGNLCQPLLGGITLTDVRVVQLVEALTGNVPDDLAIRDEKDPWSITFAAERPVDVRFANTGFTLVIRGKRFTRGDQELKRSLDISAAFKIERTAKGSKFTRQGEVQVVLPGAKQLSVSQVAMKTFVKKKFETLFKSEIQSEGVGLPGRWGKAGKLQLAQLYCDQGWLAFGWRVRKEPQVAMDD